MKTCGTCNRWELADTHQMVEFPSPANRPFDIGRCLEHGTDRFRAELPIGDCHQRKEGE